MIVTIVTATLNAARYLHDCMASVRLNEETGIEVEHVIVDGGSTDGTVELAEAFGLRVITGKDSGIFDAINKGSFNSNGELLGCLGGDDLMLPGGLRAIVDAYRKTGRRWVAGPILWIDGEGRNLGKVSPPPIWVTAKMLACLGWNPIWHAGTFVTRDLFDELGGFDIAYRDSGDYELFIRARQIERYVVADRPVACFRRTGVNNSVVNGCRMQRENQAILDQFGPKSKLERHVWRCALKCQINFNNPVWFTMKMAQRLLGQPHPQ